MLVHTGLSRAAAKFQARSAFTGVGYTTDEAESIVNHPVRRRIVMSLMLIGNVGVISAVASLILTFVNTNNGQPASYLRVIIIVGSMFILWLLSKSKWVENALVHGINKALRKFTTLNVKDYVELLNLTGEYEITVLKIHEGDWLEGKMLKDLKLRQEGVNLIGIQRRDGTYLGTPYGDTSIKNGDQLILYGRENTLRNLEKRKQDLAGEQEHEKAVREQQIEKEKQDREDLESEEKPGDVKQ
jgi:NhaP-type Na+/H+ and K+/H+ antiporter